MCWCTSDRTHRNVDKSNDTKLDCHDTRAYKARRIHGHVFWSLISMGIDEMYFYELILGLR